MTPSRLKASIILPTYKRPHKINDAVRSVLAQTYRNWELIVSDNGGDGYRFDDSRIVVIDSQGIASAAYARNRAIRHATGDLVSYLDDDDELEPDYLESFVEVFETRPEAQIVKCHMLRRGLVNESYGTPTTMLRRPYASPDWEPIIRQDQHYFLAIIERNGFSEETGTLLVIPRTLCLSGVDPDGGLRAGNL